MSAALCPSAPETLRRVHARMDDSLGAAESRALKAHLIACPSCSAAARRVDPTLLFAPLSAAPSTSERRAEEREGMLMAADVLAAIDLERARRRLAPPARPARPVLRAASVVLIAGALFGIVKAVRTGSSVPAAGLPAALPTPVSAAAALPASPFTIEDLKTPGARVYQFASTSAQEPNVVFVVGRDLDI